LISRPCFPGVAAEIEGVTLMKSMLRRIGIVAALVLAALAGTVPSCGTMGGGGGMKYLIDPLPDSSIVALA
jgi:hypothetical protein